MELGELIHTNLIQWAITGIVALLFIIIGYFISSWKKWVEHNFNELFKKNDEIIENEAKCKISIAKDFVRNKNCDAINVKTDKVHTTIFEKLDETLKLINEHYAKIVYELGVSNGKIKDKNK